MTTTTANAYLRTRVMTAKPEELRLMLLDGAVKFARQAGEGMRSKNYELVYTGLTSCRAIVLELMSSIRPEADPVLAERVRSVYSFAYSELIAVSADRSPDRLSKVIELLEYERETWELLMKRLADEKTGRPTEAARARA